MGRFLAIVGAITILISQQCAAQTQNNLLRGLSAVELLIEDLNSSSTDCGLTESAVRASVMYPLSSSKIRVNSPSDVALYVNISSLYIRAEQICFANILMEASTWQHVTLDFSGEVKRSKLQLWHSSYVSSSGQTATRKTFLKFLRT